MKKAMLISLLALSMASTASAKVLKTVSCEGATLSLDVSVTTEKGEATIVAWTVEDKETGAGSNFMGYLYTEGSLKEFSSTDLGSDLEVSGSVALLTFGDKEETLFCR